MLLLKGILFLALTVGTSLASQSPRDHYARMAAIAHSEDLFVRDPHSQLLRMRDLAGAEGAFNIGARGIHGYPHFQPIRRFNSYPQPGLRMRSPKGAGGGGGKGGSNNGKAKNKGDGPKGNCRQACKFCKGKKGDDGKPCAYHDVEAPPGVDKKKFDKCKAQLAQNAGVNPGGMGAVSAGSGMGGALATVAVESINDKLTKGTCAGVIDQVRAGISSGGGQCC